MEKLEHMTGSKREKPGQLTFKIVGAPLMTLDMGLYRALILGHGERVTGPWKYSFTRKYSHEHSLLIMVCC